MTINDHSLLLDSLREFLAQQTRRHFGRRVQTRVLHQAYTAWAVAHGAPSMTEQMFGRLMRTLGLVHMTSQCVFWLDLDLIDRSLAAPCPTCGRTAASVAISHPSISED